MLTGLLDPRKEERAKTRRALHPDLATLTPGAIFDLAWSLGRLLIPRPVGKRLHDAALPVETKVMILETAAELIGAWPEALPARLHSAFARDPAEAHKALRSIRALAGKHARWPEQHDLLARTVPQLLGRARKAVVSLHRQAVDRGEAQRILGVTWKQVPRLVAAGAIDLVEGGRRDRLATTMDGTSLRRLRALKDDCIPMASAASRLGISFHGVEQLICIGLLKDHQEPAVRIMFQRRQVSLQTFEQLLANVERCAVADPGKATIPLRRAVSVIGGREKPWGSIVHAIVAGRLRAHMKPATTRVSNSSSLVHRLQVAPDQLERLTSLTFDQNAHPGFVFANDVPWLDAQETLNLTARLIMASVAAELGDAVLPSRRLDRASVIRLAKERISPAEISMRFCGGSPRMPTPIRDNRIGRVGPSGWNRRETEALFS